MTLLEINTKKAEIIQSILNDIYSEESLEELDRAIQRLATRQAPCQYSAKELRERALLAIEEMEAGKGTPHEEMKKRFSA